MNKNKRIGIAGILFFAALFAVALFNQNPEMQQQEQEDGGLIRYEASFLDVFDTKSDIMGYSTSKEEFTQQVTLLKEKLEYYHKLYDIYNDYEGIQNIKTINDNAGIAPVEVSRDIIDLLLHSKEMYYQTNGQMNVALGNVLKIWHNYREEGRNNPQNAVLPTMEELLPAIEYCDIEKIVIDEVASTVYLADANMSIDVGSIGKGYAVQRVAEYAKEIGMDSVLLSIGGNICAVGQKPNGKNWNVGIQNPDVGSEDAYVKIVSVSDVSVVTSGDYQRYYIVDGEKYCHIIDSDTLMPADYFTSVSIICEDSGRADALSTSVFNMTFEEGKAFVKALEGVEAMWILDDGSIEYSEGFEQYIVD